MTAPIDPMTPRQSPSEQSFPPVADLPPVEAPSAGFIVQLFVIPALIVLVVIGVWLLFGKLAGGERDAMEYVRLIRASSSNWRAANRAAFELASLIQNDPKLATDPKLLGELTDLLEHQLDNVENPEITQYVALALGRFNTLEAESSSGQKIDPISALDRALDAKYPEAVRIAAAHSLAKHAARLEGALNDPRPIAALRKAAGANDSVAVRQMAVYALGFFGDNATDPLRETLVDDDRFVRFNAAVALARRGDSAAAGTLKDMLSSARLESVVPKDSAAEKESKIESIELEALNALQTAVAHGKPDLARSLLPEITALTTSGLVSVRNNAQALVTSLQEKRGPG
jgi:HEAT repeat protein